MAVTSVREQFNNRHGAFDPNSTKSTRAFRVITNSAYDSEQDIFSSGMLPSYNSSHPKNIGIYAREFEVHQENGAFMWLATVGYNNEVLGSLPALATEAQPVPTLRRVQVTGKSLHGKEALTKAPLITTATIANSPVVSPGSFTIPTTDSAFESSSREAFEGFERDVDQFVWTIKWNVNFLPFWIQSLSGAINNSSVNLLGLILPKWSLKLRGFSHTDLLIEKQGPYLSYSYYTVSFDLHFKRDLWITGVQDRGFYKLDSGAQKEILLGDGSKPVVPVPLDGAGVALASPTDTNILYRWYAPNPEASFQNLPIPATAF